ncbi:carbohydrate kinase family protein [Ruminococcus sp. Marseille-P6503]|uniref:carbohydrate kinase family protein n=1 Tax=Ruminococcus sp. Marseille-P6503 TaxID=2364796 RepID=UPI000F5357B7|nr:carbohydrate kinase family protein [Ruminococcus sp. Marseille-P6503]
MSDYIYMYGMVMSTYAYLLCGNYPEADGYAEIKEKYHHLGGETGTAAAILCSLGAKVKLGGSHYGNLNRDLILGYFADKSADLSELVYEDFEGVEDRVIIDKSTRTCFGEFGRHFSREIPFYEPPREESVKNAVCVAADPFFGDEIARLCVKHDKPYATIDCDHDSYMNERCAVNAVSHQYLDGHYPDKSYEELYRLYTENTDGLVIFTLGEKGAMYGRKGRQPEFRGSVKVDVVSTLGAGDSFKAGTVYGLYKGFDDDRLVRFACAAAGAAVSRFPIPLRPPELEEVERLMKQYGGKL